MLLLAIILLALLDMSLVLLLATTRPAMREWRIAFIAATPIAIFVCWEIWQLRSAIEGLIVTVGPFFGIMYPEEVAKFSIYFLPLSGAAVAMALGFAAGSMELQYLRKTEPDGGSE